jgi:hypothetical protein
LREKHIPFLPPETTKRITGIFSYASGFFGLKEQEFHNTRILKKVKKKDLT